MNNRTGFDIQLNNTDIGNNITNSLNYGGRQLVWVFLSINILVSLFIIVSNGLVLWTVYKIEALRTVTSMFIVNLSVVDLLVGVFILFIIVTDTIMPLAYDTYTPKKFLCIGRAFFLGFLFMASLFGLIGVAVDRYVAIVHPLRYVSIMNVTKAKIMLVCKWAYILSITAVMFIDGVNVYQPGQGCAMGDTLNSSYFIFIKLNLLIPVFIIFVLNGKILYVAFKQRTKIINELASIDNASAVAYKNEHSIMKATTIVNVIFIIMYGQYMVIDPLKLDTEWFTTIWQISAIIMRLNSGVNPWIFVMFHKKYKKAFLVALKLKTIGASMD
ncbi:unnamed protein product [Owenia fusiformis]|uniref:Uncharacterized protein n=1 Tax=Owenia fusiformis TaxID=6347 RepID=A0A8J1UBK8_OWEFU|nr:unnamed protein product [Owenia fusiformis]